MSGLSARAIWECFKANEATIEGVFRGRQVFICLVDNGDRGGVSRGSQMRRSSYRRGKKGACGSWAKIETSELKNRAGGDLPTRREGLGETGSRLPASQVFSFKRQKKQQKYVIS